MKNLTDEKLKQASILDFSRDIKVLRAALDDDWTTIEEIESGITNDNDRMFGLFSWAEYNNDQESIDRLDRIFEAELAAIFKE